jgi:hypothetical protein
MDANPDSSDRKDTAGRKNVVPFPTLKNTTTLTSVLVNAGQPQAATYGICRWSPSRVIGSGALDQEPIICVMWSVNEQTLVSVANVTRSRNVASLVSLCCSAQTQAL